jgi:response regulator of citrate/malate metabolism
MLPFTRLLFYCRVMCWSSVFILRSAEMNLLVDMGMCQGKGVVLIVEDEVPVLELARDILQRLGYAALLANSGEQALEPYQQRLHELAAVLLDIVMPGSGWQRGFQSYSNCERER